MQYVIHITNDTKCNKEYYIKRCLQYKVKLVTQVKTTVCIRVGKLSLLNLVQINRAIAISFFKILHRISHTDSKQQGIVIISAPSAS